MSDDFGLLNPVASTYLERIAREERLIEDQPRKLEICVQDLPKESGQHPAEDIEQTDDSTSSQHIDLRI